MRLSEVDKKTVFRSVCISIRDSVYDSVRDSVKKSVFRSVTQFIRSSVFGSTSKANRLWIEIRTVYQRGRDEIE